MTESLTNLLPHYGLLAVFIGTFLEGEGVLLGAGILAGSGMLHPVSVWATAAIGAWTGHLFWFWVGRGLGSRYLFPRFKQLQERVDQADRVIRSHPGTAILILQYLYGARIIGAIAFGLTHLSLGWFLFYEALNCTIWAAIVESLGYFIGEGVIRFFHGWGQWIWIILTIAAVIWIFPHLKPNNFKRAKNG
jgi:membrane protein DedA with SNARE-associated domain